jgi:gas vesicle protein
MWWRANDVLVGVVTGIFSAVIASLLEAFFLTERVLSFGQHGGGIGSKLPFIGMIVGGIIGFIMGAVVRPRPQPR